ncbi:hypothetical protein CO610_09335 [Lysobacteraceae bacterium NML95-0200]|nr:hypothetical protein CO610_09335 [Xanthomonadaceae bacterium NML95-0200]
MKAPLFCLSLVLILSACAEQTSEDNPDPGTVSTLQDSPSGSQHAPLPLAEDGLDNTIWRLRDARNRNGQRILAIVQKPGVPFSLTFARGHLQLRNSCNLISGEYLIGEQGAFAIDRIQRSTKLCPDPAEMAAETEIMSVLEKAVIVEMPNGKAKNRLRIRDAGGRTLSFEAIPLPSP